MAAYTDLFLYLILCVLCLLLDGVCTDRGDEYIDWQVGWGEGVPQDPVFRVVNGQPANLGDVPYQVALRLPTPLYPGRYKTFCGGALIASDRLLTAAHCFHSLMPTGSSIGAKNFSLVYAVAGSILNLDTIRSQDSVVGGQWRRLRSVQRPHGYSFPDHDIALVITEEKFTFNEFVMAIPFATAYSEYSGECLVAGYGRTSSQLLIHSDVLLVAYLEPISVRECSQLYHRNMSSFVCTSTILADVAKGDSGGPLVCRDSAEDRDSALGVLIGVTSASATARLSGTREQVVRSAFFTRVSNYAAHFRRGNTAYSYAETRSPAAVWAVLIYVALFSS